MYIRNHTIAVLYVNISDYTTILNCIIPPQFHNRRDANSFQNHWNYSLQTSHVCVVFCFVSRINDPIQGHATSKR